MRDEKMSMTEEDRKLLETILQPSEEFTPIPFWFFNDEPDQEKIRKQLEDYVQKGVNGIVLHPRIGVPETVPYLSEEFFLAVRFIVETADDLGMKVILYDEGMYPSGSAHGMVVAANPDFASKGIILRDEPGNGETIAKLEDGRYLMYDFTGGTIRGIHFGEDDGEKGAPASADILNPDAVDLFIQLTHDQYYEHLKEYFGNTVIAFFTDEPTALGRNSGGFRTWVKGMEKDILESGGEIEELTALFEKKENRTTAIYHRLVKKHLRDVFYGRLSAWCEAHGIALVGHPAESDDVEEQLYFQIPGQDLIMRRIVPKKGGIWEEDSVHAKLAADVARHLGCRRNANECFGVCYRERMPWYFTAEDMKWYIDWLGIRGVNLFIPHAFYYSVEGKRSEERPPDVGPNNIWWKHYRSFSDYMKRLSYLMTDSVNGAKVAVICDNNKVPCQEITAFYENQVEFNYLPVGLLSECRIEAGKLCIQDYCYKAVADPLGILDLETAMRMKCVGLLHNIADILSDAKWRSVLTEQNCPDLRIVRLRKNGIDMYLLSNEGESEIFTGVRFADVDNSNPLCVDLWKGQYARVHPDTKLRLAPCETVLYIFDQGAVPAEEAVKGIYLGDWTNRFSCIEETDNQAIYETIYYAESVTGSEYFTVAGEEMVECYCNGKFVDVSFWNEHKLAVGAGLQAGENIIRLVITGNAANIYTDAEIEFGLGVVGG